MEIDLKEHYKGPFRYDDAGQMVWDKNDNQVLDIRDWGRLQYLGAEKGVAVQDAMGTLIADLLTKEFKK